MHDQDELEDLRTLDVARVLRELCLDEGRLEAPGSTSGLVAERLRQGLATREAYQGEGQAGIRARLADRLLLMRDLTPAEEAACRIRYTGVAGHTTYERTIRVADLQEGSAEEVVDPHPRDMDGKPLGGEWIRVRGIKVRMPSYQEVAQEMAARGYRTADGEPMTQWAVQRLLRSASEKIRTAIAAKLMMAELGERACG